MASESRGRVALRVLAASFNRLVYALLSFTSATLLLMGVACSPGTSPPSLSDLDVPPSPRTIGSLTPRVDPEAEPKADLKTSLSVDATSSTAPRSILKMDTAKDNTKDRGRVIPSEVDSSLEVFPGLQNLLIQELGPYDPEQHTYGDLKYDSRFGNLVFDEFGRQSRPDHPGYYNPNFEFKAPADTVLIAPISGVVTYLEWQATGPYPDHDWELHIRPSLKSSWSVGIDHIVSLDCVRQAPMPAMCDLPLVAGNLPLEIGTNITAGQPIGYIGNWRGDPSVGITGRTEITLFKYSNDFQSTINHCPTMHLDRQVSGSLKEALAGLMVSYETWSGELSTYAQESMPSPGCLYVAIREVRGETNPVTD